MVEPESTRQELARAAGGAIARVLALIVGVVLMVTGLAMGVSLVLLPVGIPLGLAGLVVFLWGVFPSQQRVVPTEPPRRP
jgi:uncharacterized membrane protein YccF (DUF307 family)